MPGKLLYIAETLSRAPSPTTENDARLQEEAEALMEMHFTSLPASTERCEEYRKSQAEDPVCSSVIVYCKNGWPEKNGVEICILPFWKFRGELTIDKDSSQSPPKANIPENPPGDSKESKDAASMPTDQFSGQDSLMRSTTW